MKQYIILTIATLYGLTMGGTALAAYLGKQISFPLMLLNLGGALLLIIALWFLNKNQLFFIGGSLLLLITAAIFNGLSLNGAITPSHLIIRIILSIIIFIGVWKV